MIIYHIFFTSHVMEVADFFFLIVMHIWVKQIMKGWAGTWFCCLIIIIIWGD